MFNKVTDSLVGTAGINTVGLSTDTNASGIHKFRTKSKNTLRSINVIESGSGYQYRTLKVQPSQVSTAFDSINYKDHGFNQGDKIEYSFGDITNYEDCKKFTENSEGSTLYHLVGVIHPKKISDLYKVKKFMEK